LTDEKKEIARGYLIPKALKATGLAEGPKLEISDEVVLNIINNYSREPGVRQLEKNIEKICRKSALKLLTDKTEKVSVSVATLPSFLGKSKYRADQYYEMPPPGIVMGLGANNMGGSGLFVETVAEQLGEKAELQLTGQVGDVMRESVSIAYTYAKNLLKKLLPENEFFLSSTLHLNWLHGGIPKDGPSGGCAIVTSLLSIALNRPVNPKITMTGEVTLHGRVLAIGGIKEKTMAGRRAGANIFIFPRSNKPEFDKLPVHLRTGITVHFVEDYREILPIVFPEVATVQFGAIDEAMVA
jgi:ATP-dependent Lon protease